MRDPFDHAVGLELASAIEELKRDPQMALRAPFRMASRRVDGTWCEAFVVDFAGQRVESIAAIRYRCPQERPSWEASRS